MDRYEGLIALIGKKKEWKSDEEFLIDTLTKNTIRLLNYCYDDIGKGIYIRTLLLLRQIQENCIAFLGLSAGVLTAHKFAYSKIEPQKIFAGLTKKHNEDSEIIIQLSSMMQSMKSFLNKYAHTNLDVSMLIFVEEHQTYETTQFNRLVAQMWISLIEIIFIATANHYYGFKILFPPIINLKPEIKKITNIKYTADKLPEGYKEFFNSSKIFNGYFSSLISDLKMQINDYYQLAKSKPEEN